MARIRSIKPEFFTNDRLSELPECVHLAAAGLLTYADDYGYFNANPGLIKAAIFPLRESFVSIPEILRRLQTIDYLRLSKGVDGRDYGWIVEFDTHQRVSHPTESKIKKLASFPEPLRNPPEPFVPEGKGKEQGTGNRERKTDLSGKPDLAFAKFWEAYPRHEARRRAQAAWAKEKPEIDAVLAAISRQRAHGCLEQREADGRSLIPLPASWINGRRWEDELAPSNGAGRIAENFRGCL